MGRGREGAIGAMTIFAGQPNTPKWRNGTARLVWARAGRAKNGRAVMSLTDISLPADAPERGPSAPHLCAYREYKLIGQEVRALEECDVPAITCYRNQGMAQIDAAVPAWERNAADLARDLENARLTLDYLHARQRQHAAGERFGKLLDEAAGGEPAPEVAVRP